MRIVLDASTALAAVLPDEHGAYARAAVAAAVQHGLVVPAVWPYEIQNGLAMAIRRKRIDAQSLNDALEALRGLTAVLEAPQRLGNELRLAQAYRLTAYDAAYIAVAIERGASLATTDRRLREAAENAGIALFLAPAGRPRKTRNTG